MTKKKVIVYWIIVVIIACIAAFIEGNIWSRQEARQEKESVPAVEESGKKENPEKKKTDESEKEAPYKRMTWDEYMQQQHDHIGEGEE